MELVKTAVLLNKDTCSSREEDFYFKSAALVFHFSTRTKLGVELSCITGIFGSFGCMFGRRLNFSNQ